MADELSNFERVVRSLRTHAYVDVQKPGIEHPFETRNIYPGFPSSVKKLFDDGHYSQATFEAFKFVDKEVARLANSSESGYKLMMAVFSDISPSIKLTNCLTTSEKDEQKGFQFLFAGSAMALRNPRGHEYAIRDSLDDCLDHLAVASVLLRRLESAGLRISVPA